MTIWATTSYTRTPEGLEESHRDLTPEELPTAVYAVEASDNRGRNFASNGLRWQDVEDAKRWAAGLSMRWFGATDIRVVRVTPPVDVQRGLDAIKGYEVVEIEYQTLGEGGHDEHDVAVPGCDACSERGAGTWERLQATY
jgi:hypothetical protein